METESACRLINQALTYKPKWKFEAESNEKRFEGTITVCIHYPAFASEREYEGEYTDEIMTYAKFRIVVSDCDDMTLYRRLLEKLLKIEEHEAREFFRVQPTNWAPYHPHRVDGIRNWGAEHEDLMFGVV